MLKIAQSRGARAHLFVLGAALWPPTALLFPLPQAECMPTKVMNTAIIDVVVILANFSFPAGTRPADLPARPTGLLAAMR
mmetsp:Transcript_54429/g.155003  ORF Transcript_54429/g.155003 Transcript_54429/m.155003 type:complete len:80 (+) Transcript_54429:295-534(+)